MEFEKKMGAVWIKNVSYDCYFMILQTSIGFVAKLVIRKLKVNLDYKRHAYFTTFDEAKKWCEQIAGNLADTFSKAKED